MATIWTNVAIFFTIGLIIVLPAVLLLHALDYLRNPRREGERGVVRAIARMPILLLGIVSILIGFSIIGWVIYNVLVEEQKEYSGPKSLVGGFGIGPACLAFGIMAVRASLRSPTTARMPDEPVDESAEQPGMFRD